MIAAWPREVRSGLSVVSLPKQPLALEDTDAVPGHVRLHARDESNVCDPEFLSLRLGTSESFVFKRAIASKGHVWAM